MYFRQLPTRRAIIMLLAVGTLTPNAIAGHFNSSRQAVSKHLQILTECEIAAFLLPPDWDLDL